MGDAGVLSEDKEIVLEDTEVVAEDAEVVSKDAEVVSKDEEVVSEDVEYYLEVESPVDLAKDKVVHHALETSCVKIMYDGWVVRKITWFNSKLDMVVFDNK